MTIDIAKLRSVIAAAPLSIERECVDPGPQSNDFYQVTAACDEFYEAARQALPALLDRCEAAEREVAEQKDALDSALDDIFGLQPVNATFGDALQSLAQNVAERSREYETLRTNRDRLAAECERLRGERDAYRNDYYNMHHEGGPARRELRLLKPELERLRALVMAACDSAEEGWEYAGDYFRDKWCGDRITAIRAEAKGEV